MPKKAKQVNSAQRTMVRELRQRQNARVDRLYAQQGKPASNTGLIKFLGVAAAVAVGSILVFKLVFAILAVDLVTLLVLPLVGGFAYFVIGSLAQFLGAFVGLDLAAPRRRR